MVKLGMVYDCFSHMNLIRSDVSQLIAGIAAVSALHPDGEKDGPGSQQAMPEVNELLRWWFPKSIVPS